MLLSLYGNQCHLFYMYNIFNFVNTGIEFFHILHQRKASLMTQAIKAISELTPSSTEEDTKNTFNSWASSYEVVR